MLLKKNIYIYMLFLITSIYALYLTKTTKGLLNHGNLKISKIQSGFNFI